MFRQRPGGDVLDVGRSVSFTPGNLRASAVEKPQNDNAWSVRDVVEVLAPFPDAASKFVDKIRPGLRIEEPHFILMIEGVDGVLGQNEVPRILVPYGHVFELVDDAQVPGGSVPEVQPAVQESVALGENNIFNESPLERPRLDHVRLVVVIVSCRQQKGHVPAERSFQLCLRQRAVLGSPHVGEGVAGVEDIVLHERGQAAMKLLMDVVLGGHIDPSFSGTAKLGRVRIFVHREAPDAQDRHIQSVGRHPIDDNLRLDRAGADGRVVGKHRRNGEELIILDRQAQEEILANVDRVGVVLRRRRGERARGDRHLLLQLRNFHPNTHGSRRARPDADHHLDGLDALSLRGKNVFAFRQVSKPKVTCLIRSGLKYLCRRLLRQFHVGAGDRSATGVLHHAGECARLLPLGGRREQKSQR